MKQYDISGMSCAACSARVEKAVSKVEGVSSVSVSLLTNSMAVDGDADSQAIIQAVEHAGYGASEKGKSEAAVDDKHDTALGEIKKLKTRFIASLIFLIPLMYVSMGHMMWSWPLPSWLADNHVAMGLIQLLFTTIIMVINQHFFISGFTSLIHGAPNMDTLVTLGASASYGYSIYALFAMTDAMVRMNHDDVMAYMHEFYFESAAMILTLITLGKLLEAISKGRTTDALKGLMNLAPKRATIIRDGAEVQVDIAEVSIGDIFVVKPGESIPVDGVVLEGNSAVDESALTGESIPVDKAPEDKVSAATINQSGYIKCRATRVGEDTTLSQIIRMVSDAAATKAPIAKVADKVSGVFVPTVIGIAAITIIVWLLAGQTIGFALARGISVLVISCPCALGLATPVAIMVGNGVGAKQGILFKTAVSLEETGKIDVIALDKTGTITMGKPEVTDIYPSYGVSEDELVAYAYGLERMSEHPLAHAVVKYFEEHNSDLAVGIEDKVTDFAAVPGNGLTAMYGNERVYGGNLNYIEKYAEVNADIRDISKTYAENGKTPLFFAKVSENGNAKMLGIIAVADVIKPDSVEAIAALQDMGIHVVMLTGDNEKTAQAIGKQVGVDNVVAGVLPDGKEQVIRSLLADGKYKVAMVGDGINDAPALTRADIGIAIGAGTDIAIDAADVVLMKSSINDVVRAIRLSRTVLRNIHENLFWAFFYNVIGIPLAAGVWYPLLGWKLNPMFGAAAMSLSSFCVVTNALRINLCKLNKAAKKNRTQIESDKAHHINDIVNQINKKMKGENDMKKTMIIEGMMCGHCEARVKKCLEAIDGVEEAVVSHESKSAVVSMSSEVADDVLRQAVEAQDYKVVEIK